MKKIGDYLKEARAKCRTDEELANYLGTKQPTVTRYLNGVRIPEPEIAKRLAEFLGEKPSVVIMAAEAQRASSKEMRMYFEKLGKQIAMTGAITLSALLVVAYTFGNKIVSDIVTNVAL